MDYLVNKLNVYNNCTDQSLFFFNNNKAGIMNFNNLISGTLTINIFPLRSVE